MEDGVARVEQTIAGLYRQTELAVREATLLVGADGRIVGSHKAGALLGRTDESLRGEAVVPDGWQLLDADDMPLAIQCHPATRALAEQVTVEALVGLAAPDGTIHRLRLVAHPIHDEEVAVDVVVERRSRRAETRERVVNQERRFRTLADMLPVAVYEATPSGEITYVNSAFARLTGYRTAAEVPDLPMLEIVHPDDLASVLDAAGRAADAGGYQARYRVQHRDGSARWVTSRLSLLVDDDGKVAGFVGAIEDVDDLQRAEEESRQLADIVASASDAVAVWEDDRLIYLNPAARALVARTAAGARSDAPVAALLETLSHPEVDEALAGGNGRWVGDVRLEGSDGTPIHVSLAVTSERGRGGSRRVVAIARDIEDHKRREELLAHHATHDPLTGLANRTLLDEHVATHPGSAGDLVVAFYADIDRFKAINDEHGHAVGDAVIVAVARRLAHAVRSGDLVARTGGDEIVGWCTSVTDLSGVAELATRLVAVIAEQPVDVDGLRLDVSISLGIAATDDGATGDLVSRADRALYEAKRRGRNTWVAADDLPA